MAAASYSFLDVAVLDEVRSRFATGDALVILSIELDEVIWANGPGAALFGHPDIMAAMGAPSKFGVATRRQIAATPGFPAIGRDRAILVRMAAGSSSRAAPFLASEIILPDGEPAILLAAPAATGGGRSDAEIATRAVGGFSEMGHYMAFVDEHGSVEASSDGFCDLGIGSRMLASLASGLGTGRIAKRMLPAAKGRLPTGMARLTDDKLLVVVVDEDWAAAEAPPAADGKAAASDSGAGEAALAGSRPADASGNEALAGDEKTTSPSKPVQKGITAGARSEAGAAADHDGWYFSRDEDQAGQSRVQDEATSGARDRDGEPGSEAASDAPAAPKRDEPGAGTPDPIYANPAEGAAEPEPASPGEPPVKAEGAMGAAAEKQEGTGTKATAVTATDRASPPVRFVWRTDAEGRFSQISPEFSAAVGHAAADIVGRRFKDIAEALGLDPSGEIAGLLARRDTWSGRSVLWPLTGTDLRIPVDLAALPVYDRNRNFEGFRGFGVARAGDAVVKPQALEGSIAGADARPIPGQAPAASGIQQDASGDEMPVPPVETQPEGRSSDRVISLAEHRQPTNDRVLSSGERTAFQQIGERLKMESGLKAGEPQTAVPATPLQGLAAGLGPGDRADEVDGATVQRRSGDAEEAGVEPGGGTGGARPGRDDNLTANAEEAAAGRAAPTPPEECADSGGAELPPANPTAPPSPPSVATPAGPVRRPAAGPSRGRDGGLKAVPRKPVRPGLSLLDFARWDRPQGKGQAVSGGEEAAEEAPDEETPAAGPPYGHGIEPAPASRGPEVHQSATMEESAALPARTGADRGSKAAPHESAPRQNGAAHAAEAKREAQPGEKSSSDTPPRVEDAARVEAEGPRHSENGASGAATPELPSPERRWSDTSILEKLPVPVLVHSGDVLHYANAEFLTLTAYQSIAELAQAGGIGGLFIDPYDSEEARELRDRQLLLRNRRGEEFPVKAFLQSVPWNGGKALLLVLARSQGEPGAAQSPLIPELEARVAELRTIIDTATDGVVLISLDGTIRSISRPAEALFGFDSDEVAGKPFTSLFAIESQRAARDYLSGLSDHGVASVLNDGREVIGREAEGRFIPLFMTIGKLPKDGGYCAVVRDITQWKRAEEDLTQARALAERASAHKTDFLARISHEIRTPLNAIIGFSELMMDEKFGPVANDRYRDYLRDINRSGNHVLDLVNDLLDISKIEAGQQDMAYEAVSLNETLAETVAMMQPQANRERVIIRSSFASKLPDVVADLRSVRQIALNILSNAVRYTQAGGQVIVSTSYETTGEVVMRVRDTGIGMTQAEIEQALKPFKQIASLKRARGDGTGLGLPLTKAMVEANRAKFSIHSTPGEGTLVEVSFPSTRVLAE